MKQIYRLLTFIFFALSFMLSLQAQDRKVLVCDKSWTENDYKKWLKKDAFYIITNPEKEEFLKLKTNDEKEDFIKKFWKRRDPTPETEKNEFQETYYERIAFANEHFASGIPGWKTDRGMIFIWFGKPDNIEKGRGKFEGLTDILFEKWSYKQLDGEDENTEFTFIDPIEINEFRLEKGKREKLIENNKLTLIMQISAR